MCECDNPACTLPDGRCTACNTPTEACTNTELCAACAEKAAAIYAADAAVAGPDGAPWGLFNVRADGSVEIQRDDESDVFEHDEDACCYVVERISVIRHG